jgi:hypothetical protein
MGKRFQEISCDNCSNYNIVGYFIIFDLFIAVHFYLSIITKSYGIFTI